MRHLLMLRSIIFSVITIQLFLTTQNTSWAQVSLFEKTPHHGTHLKAQLLLKPSENATERELGGPQPTPVVFWHGMGDTAYGSVNTERQALQRQYPGMKVFSVQIGSNSVEDEMASYFANMNDQVANVCREILENKAIKAHGSFNAVGFSQGGQFLRAVIQRCPLRENNIKVKNFISLGGQHQGVYGLPRCDSPIFCDHIRQLLTTGAYEKTVQEHVVQAQYWHDPLNEESYQKKNIFLSDLNNELSVNETYRTNLLALDNMVLVQFEQDEMIVPRNSSLFGFFVSGQKEKIESLYDGRIYKEDRLGLKQLDESGRLRMISIPGGHLKYKMAWFMQQIAAVYLNN